MRVNCSDTLKSFTFQRLFESPGPLFISVELRMGIFSPYCSKLRPLPSVTIKRRQRNFLKLEPPTTRVASTITITRVRQRQRGSNITMRTITVDGHDRGFRNRPIIGLWQRLGCSSKRMIPTRTSALGMRTSQICMIARSGLG